MKYDHPVNMPRSTFFKALEWTKVHHCHLGPAQGF